MEYKTYSGRIEVKAADDANMTFEGFAACYGNVDDYGDVVQPGAFADTMAKHDAAQTMPAMFWNHDARSLPIGVWIEWEDTPHGLKFSGRFIDTQMGRDAYQAVKARAVNGLSIGYTKNDWEKVRQDGATLRHLKSVNLFEVSVVTFPANPLTLITDVKEKDLNTDEDIGAAFDALMEQFSALRARIVPADPATPDEEKAEGIDDDEPSDEAAAEQNEEPTDDPEREAKYLAAIEAVKTLRLKLQQENHG